MRATGRFQDIRISKVSTALVRRLKAALLDAGGSTINEWFTQQAAQTAAAYENRMKHGRRT
jgi:hypothetical protein